VIDGTPEGDRVPSAPPRHGRRAVAPELLAAVLAVAVVVVIGGGVLAAGAPVPTASVEPAGTPGPVSFPAPSRALEDPAIAICLEINGRLETDRVALGAELAASAFEPGNVATILRSINADLIAAEGAAERLQRLPAAALVGTRLATFYGDLQKQISAALANSVNNAPAYKAAAIATRTALAEMATLDALLEGLRSEASAPPASPSAGPSAPGPSAPGPSAAGPSGRPGPSTAPTPTPTASPSAGGSPAVVDGMVNAGFESGVGPPWELLLAGPGSATLEADPGVHSGGAASARVDITVAGDERTAVVVRQGGLSIEAGAHYVASISARATTTREVRVRIASAAGDTYATRLFTVGPEWQVLTIDSTVFATDPNAYLEVDLGRFAVTTWLDDASFMQVAPTGS
jgi:hypothetical protein